MHIRLIVFVSLVTSFNIAFIFAYVRNVGGVKMFFNVGQIEIYMSVCNYI